MATPGLIMGVCMLDDYVGLFWLLGIVGVTILVIVTICILKIASRESRREERIYNEQETGEKGRS